MVKSVLKYLLSQGWHLWYLIIFGILNLYPPCDTEYETETITGWQVLVSQMLRLQSQEHRGPPGKRYNWYNRISLN